MQRSRRERRETAAFWWSQRFIANSAIDDHGDSIEPIHDGKRPAWKCSNTACTLGMILGFIKSALASLDAAKTDANAARRAFCHLGKSRRNLLERTFQLRVVPLYSNPESTHHSLTRERSIEGRTAIFDALFSKHRALLDAAVNGATSDEIGFICLTRS